MESEREREREREIEREGVGVKMGVTVIAHQGRTLVVSWLPGNPPSTKKEGGAH